MVNIVPCFNYRHDKDIRYSYSLIRYLPEVAFFSTVTVVGILRAFFMPVSGRVHSTPPPALNESGRLGESRYAKTTTPTSSNRSNKNSSYNQVILVMTLPIGGEVKRLVIQYGYFKLKDNRNDTLLPGVGGHRTKPLLKHRITFNLKK